MLRQQKNKEKVDDESEKAVSQAVSSSEQKVDESITPVRLKIVIEPVGDQVKVSTPNKLVCYDIKTGCVLMQKSNIDQFSSTEMAKGSWRTYVAFLKLLNYLYSNRIWSLVEGISKK